MLQCFILVSLCVISATQAASIPEKSGIPVEVVYEDNHPAHIGVRNLQEKIQISPEDLLKEQANVDEPEIKPAAPYINGVKNLDEKNQLAIEDRNEASEHLPSDPESIQTKSLLREDQVTLVNRAKEIIYAGLGAIRSNIDKTHEVKPNEEAWRSLNQTLDEFFAEQSKKIDGKQDNSQNQNNQVIQNIISGFQNLTGGFLQNFQQNNRPNGTEDEQQGSGPGFVQNFINGVQQVINNVNNIGGQNPTTSSTVLGDTGTGSTQRPNVISNVINSVQQIFTGSTQAPISSSNNQSDTGVDPPGNPPGFFQGAINQFNQVVNNLRPTSSPPPAGQGDEGTTPQRPIGIIQSIGNQIGSAFNPSNIFGQSTNKPPEDESGKPTQPTNFIQNIGQAIQNANPFRPTASPTTQAPQQAGATNLINQGAQVIGSQIEQITGGQPGGNSPIETLQGAITNATDTLTPQKASAEESNTEKKS